MRRGLTLIESLMAAGILFIVVTAITGAVTAGQQHALEARGRIAGSLVAEELLGRLAALAYADLPGWDGYREEVGAMIDFEGANMPDSVSMLGREVVVTTALEEVTPIGVNIRGRFVTVRAFKSDGGVVAELERFVPEPRP